MKALLHSTDDVVGTVAQSPLKMGDRVMEVIQDMTWLGKAAKRDNHSGSNDDKGKTSITLM